MKAAPADVVRACIAAHVLGPERADSSLGAVTLQSHQASGVERVRRILEMHGGALLADDVGLGKTFVALAVARDASDALVLAPASLRHVWEQAATAADVEIRFASFEQLGRGRRPSGTPDIVLVDEAHHLRSRRTVRFAGARDICCGAKVLLLSATPVQNRLDDLRAILSLFLGERAFALTPEALAQCVVRRTARDVGPEALRLPMVRQPSWLAGVEDADCLEQLLALPPPVPPLDGGDAGVLLTYTLVRQWASSRAALRAALHRRLARAHAIEDALHSGRMPTRSELVAWCYADGAQQLTFPEFVAGATASDVVTLLEQIHDHVDGVRMLLATLGRTPDPDAQRASLLRDLVRSHAGERLIAFSEYADTIAAYYRLLVPTERCAMLTHSGGRVVSGAISRRELLQRFAPGASTTCNPRERIDLLLSTDVLSEGVSLQDASVVVHLDLGWNPARLEQRVGRVRRIGAARETVSVYVMPPPAPAERMLELERRLQVKLADAARSVGIAGAILPGLSTGQRSPAGSEESVHHALREWRGDVITDVPVVAAVRAPVRAAICCIMDSGGGALIALEGDRASRSPERLRALLDHAGGEEAQVNPRRVTEVSGAIGRWLRRHSISGVVDLAALRVARSRRALLRRVDGIAHRASRHAQPAIAPLVNAARTAATITLSAGAERVLDELARAPMHDEAWLRAVGEFASLHARDAEDRAPRIVAMLLLEPDAPAT